MVSMEGCRGEHDCGAGDEDQGLCNSLGFHPQSVGELRYLCQLRDNGKTAVASAASDAGKYICSAPLKKRTLSGF